MSAPFGRTFTLHILLYRDISVNSVENFDKIYKKVYTALKGPLKGT